MIWYEENKDKLDDRLYSELKNREVQSAEWNTADTIPVLIHTKEESYVKKLSDLHVLLPGEQEGIAIANFHYISGKFTPETLKKLAQSTHVNKLHYDRKITTRLDVATATVGGDYAKKNYGLTGKGVVIAVLDTGIDPHPDFTKPENRIVHFKDFVNGKIAAYDDNGHGTHVAGCAAGNGWSSGGKYRAPASEAKLVGIKVLDSQGEGYSSSIIAGIDYCIQKKAELKIRIINLSLGGEATAPYTSDPLAMATARAVKAGIAVFTAAGNSGPNANTIDSPGIHPRVTTVGAFDDRNTVKPGDDRVADYSSEPPTIDALIKPDVYTPGTNIIAPLSPNSTIAKASPNSIVNSNYLSLSGTSMATGICSGAAAVILQAYPVLTPDLLKLYMIESLQILPSEQKGAVSLRQLLRLLLS